MRTVCVRSTLTFQDDTLLRERESCTPRKDGAGRGGEQRTWRIPACGPAWGGGSRIPPSPPGQKGEWVRGAGPGGGLTLQLTRRAGLSVLLVLLLLSWPWIAACTKGCSPRGRLGFPSTRRLWITLCGCCFHHKTCRCSVPSLHKSQAVLPSPAHLRSLLGVRRGESFPKDPSNQIIIAELVPVSNHAVFQDPNVLLSNGEMGRGEGSLLG